MGLAEYMAECRAKTEQKAEQGKAVASVQWATAEKYITAAFHESLRPHLTIGGDRSFSPTHRVPVVITPCENAPAIHAEMWENPPFQWYAKSVWMEDGQSKVYYSTVDDAVGVLAVMTS